MFDKTRNSLIDFLNNKMTAEAFSDFCKKMYHEIICLQEEMFTVDSLLIAPFIHEFAYGPYTTAELRLEVSCLLSVLDGRKAYRNFTFIKLQPFDDADSSTLALRRSFQNFNLEGLRAYFTQEKENPLTFRDILHNMLVDLLEGANFTDPEEDLFSYINCNDPVPPQKVKERILQVLEYYLGSTPFGVQINSIPNAGSICVIV